MLDKLENKLENWIRYADVWTNVYGVARSIIAFATAMTLLFNKADIFFLPNSDSPEFPVCRGLGQISIFCLVPNDYFYLDIVRLFCVILLLIVASGWRPRITGIIHWYVSFSFVQSAMAVDGGDSVAATITLLLIPITLTDPRKWHWEKVEESDRYIKRKVIALVSLIAIRVQIAILYFHATVAKLEVLEWQNGTAVWYYMQDKMLGLNPVLFDMFNWFLASKLVVIPTWGTLILQTILFAGILAPKEKRGTLLILAILMHEIFAIFLGLLTFSLTMVAILILYFRPTEFEFKKPAVFKKNKKQFIDGRKMKSA